MSSSSRKKYDETFFNDVTRVLLRLKKIWKNQIEGEMIPDFCKSRKPDKMLCVYFPFLEKNNFTKPEYFAVSKEDQDFIYLISGIQNISRTAYSKQVNKTQVFMLNRSYLTKINETDLDEVIYFCKPIPFKGTFKSPIFPIECINRKSTVEEYCLDQVVGSDKVLRIYLAHEGTSEYISRLLKNV